MVALSWAPLRDASGQGAEVLSGSWRGATRRHRFALRIGQHSSDRSCRGRRSGSRAPERAHRVPGRPGRLVRVDYSELAEPVPLQNIPSDWRIAQGSPFSRQGARIQGYFFPLKPDFVSRLAADFPQLGLGPGVAPPGGDYQEPPFDSILEAVRSEGMSITERLLRRISPRASRLAAS